MAANTSDYTPIAPWYDQTRSMPEELLEVCFDRIFARHPIELSSSILDAGCGTAQLSLPLIRRGFAVTGVDVSDAMLQIARRKTASYDNACFVVNDVRDLPFPNDCFDAIAVSKLFQHVGNWQSAVDEIVRVAKSGSVFMHVNEKGAFSNSVRKRFALECDNRDVRDRYQGFRDRSALSRYLISRGAKPLQIKTADLSWEKRVSFGDAFEAVAKRLHSEFWVLDDAAYEAVLAAVQTWVLELPDGFSTTETLNPHLTAEVFGLP